MKVPAMWNDETLSFWSFAVSLAAGAAPGDTTADVKQQAFAGALARFTMHRADKPLERVWLEMPTNMRAYALGASATGRGDAYRRELVRAFVMPWWNMALDECEDLDTASARDMLSAFAAVLSWTTGRTQRAIIDWEREGEFCGEAAEGHGAEDGHFDPVARLWHAARSACGLVGALLRGNAALAGAHAGDLAFGTPEVSLDSYRAADVMHAFNERQVVVRELVALGASTATAERYFDAALDGLSAYVWWQRRTSPVRVEQLRLDGVIDGITREFMHAGGYETPIHVRCVVTCHGGERTIHASTPWALIDKMDEVILADLREGRHVMQPVDAEPAMLFATIPLPDRAPGDVPID